MANNTPPLLHETCAYLCEYASYRPYVDGRRVLGKKTATELRRPVPPESQQ